MIDITAKYNTLRIAEAQATVKASSQATIEAIQNNAVPKGNVFEMSRSAGLLGIKKTPLILPDCHPIPIESATITFEIKDLDIIISVKVKTIYKTGVEVEAMHGASIVALNMYDMLKPIDKGIVIENIQLIKKKGGKSDFRDTFKNGLTANVIVCSDTISAGQKEDKAGKAIVQKLTDLSVTVNDYIIIPDEQDQIQERILKYHEQGTDMVILTGGTGLSSRDVTPESVLPLIDRRIPGIEETIRNYGQNRTPYAMLSRSVVGVKGKTLIMALPGSTNGAKESMDAVFPSTLHLFRILNNAQHQ